MQSIHNYMGNYAGFLQRFLDQGYEFVFFSELNNPNGQIALRHDIDFDTEYALRSAEVEHALGIKSVYFFLLRHEFYNPFAGEAYRHITAIRDMGHQVSVHFDPTLYEDFETGLAEECRFFENVFGSKVSLISFHRPAPAFQNLDAPIGGVDHTYRSKWFRDIKYFADSTGAWRFGHPHDSEEFAVGKTMQIVTHPIWWFVEGSSNLEVLKSYYYRKQTLLKELCAQNSIPFKSIVAEI
ncbi:hypothetical protein [Flaviaesturariibacter aridisoli]|uniref:Uncharacterized protein n=1 Tax=Flaviaesturariibacter aridisoli TaxID=2545761 RepID=A0A4R4E5G5_9BACT|nr:hypothetical protein [Flaviaesturariibacter aridisoli]TCZ74103.1 hypothetical protein E0486_03240 [Flaviaesturariibacter aridisoli]